jgi:hypothetical protein
MTHKQHKTSWLQQLKELWEQAKVLLLFSRYKVAGHRYSYYYFSFQLHACWLKMHQLHLISVYHKPQIPVPVSTSAVAIYW